jgi:hypothetical protein
MEILDLTPPQLEWRIYKGDTSTFNIIVVDDSDKAIDISEYTFEAILKNNEMVEIVSLDISVNGNSITLSLPTEAVLTVKAFDFAPPKFKVVATAPETDVVAAVVVLTVMVVAFATVNRPIVWPPVAVTFNVADVACASVIVLTAAAPDAFTVSARVPADALIVVAVATSLMFKVFTALPSIVLTVTPPVAEPPIVTVVRVEPLDVPVPVSVTAMPSNFDTPVLTTEIVLALFNVTLAAAEVCAKPDSRTEKF